MNNNSFLNAKEQTQQERTLVTGVCNAKVVAINPDREKLSEIVGRDVEDLKEPSYIGQNRDGDPNVRIDIWMKPVEGETYYDSGKQTNEPYKDPFKLVIFLSEKERSNKDGNKFMFINGKIQTPWGSTEEEVLNKTNRNGVKWVSSNSLRVCREGEDQLYEFFAKYINADLRDNETDLVFNDYEAILSGDTSELEEIVNAKNEEGKTINVLLGVKDGKYQEVYQYGFERGTRKTFSSLIKKAMSDYNGFRADFQNEETLQAYVRPVAPSTNTSQAEEVENQTSETANESIEDII